MDITKYISGCTVLSTVSQDADEQAWLGARTRGIGGSDIGPICNVSPFSSARQVYLHKTGQYEESIKPNEASQERMHWGHRLESVVAEEYSLRTGLKICECPAILAHKDYPWALANLDRLILDENDIPIGILECKTTSEYNNDEWDNGEILMTYIYQLNWYFFVTGFTHGAIACLVGGNKFYYYDVFRNDELIAQMFESAKSFWFDNVLALKEPPLVSVDTDWANEKYSEVVKDSEKTLTDAEANNLARTIVECKAQIKELKDTMEEAQNRIKEMLQSTEIGYTTDYIIKWSPRMQKRINTDMVKSNFPDVYEQCLKTIRYRAMTIKGGL